MTKAIREATVEEYMDLLKAGNGAMNSTFVQECFGTDQDFDIEACDAFAALAEVPAQKFLKEKFMNTPEATQEMMAAVEAQPADQAEVAVVAMPAETEEVVQTTEEAATPATEEV